MYPNPQAPSGYSRLMTELFDERKITGVSTGFQAIFGNPLSNSRTVFSPDHLLLDIDIIRANERTSALISRGGTTASKLEVKNASDQNFSSFGRLYPLSEEESSITAHQILLRIAGESPYSSQTKLDRMRVLARNNHEEHIKRKIRLFERLASQSALTGKMDSISGNSNLQYDFRRSAGNTISVATPWNQAGAEIMADIDLGCDQIRQNGKIEPDMAIIGGNAMDAMLSDDNFQKKADNRRFELIQISTNNPVPDKYSRFVEAGFKARGRLRTAKGYELWLFTYIDGYTDEAGAFQKYMPEDKALVMSSEARADRYFGPSEHLPLENARLDMMANVFGIENPASLAMPSGIKGSSDVIDMRMFHFDAYPHHNNKGIVTRTQSAPIFATTHTDGFCLLEDLYV